MNDFVKRISVFVFLILHMNFLMMHDLFNFTKLNKALNKRVSCLSMDRRYVFLQNELHVPLTEFLMYEVLLYTF